MVPHQLILITEAMRINTRLKIPCYLLNPQTASGHFSHTDFFPLFAISPRVERPAEALAHQRALRKFNSNPIKETHRDESGEDRVAQCISVQITVLCRT